MNSGPRRRGVENVESSTGGIEHEDDASVTDTPHDIERGPVSPDARNIESIADEPAPDPLTGEHGNIERP